VSVLILSLTLFVATNVDDLFVLAAFYADRRFRARDVVLGQFAGMGALVVASFVVSLATLAVPERWIGFLGLLPLALGLAVAWRELRGKGEQPDSSARDGGVGAIAVAAVTIANGSDNVAAYVPFFASREIWELGMVVAVFAALTGAWCFVAFWLVHHPTLGAPIRKYGAVLLPIVLIALGLYIFFDAGAHELIAE